MTGSTLKKCKIEGWNLAYHQYGKGDPVLLVHGITTNSFIWEKVALLLSEKYEVIVPDLLGCGDSDKPIDVEYSLVNHAQILKQFLDQLGISQIHFVGHDVGGGIGQIFVVRYPELLSDLTLVNTVAYDFWPVQPIIAMRTPIIRQLAMATLDKGTFKLVLRKAFYNKDRLTPELYAKFERQMETKEGRKAFLHFARCLNNQHLLDITNDLKSISLPVYIVRGDADLYLSGKIAQKLHMDIPGSSLQIFNSAGHFIQEDIPTELSEYLIRKFEGN